MKSIADCFESFIAKLYPAPHGPTPEQRRQLETAFHAGAHAVLHLIREAFASGGPPAQSDERLKRIDTELDAFFARAGEKVN